MVLGLVSALVCVNSNEPNRCPSQALGKNPRNHLLHIFWGLLRAANPAWRQLHGYHYLCNHAHVMPRRPEAAGIVQVCGIVVCVYSLRYSGMC